MMEKEKSESSKKEETVLKKKRAFYSPDLGMSFMAYNIKEAKEIITKKLKK